MARLLDSNALAYATTALGFTFISSVWRFYYVQLFIDHYRISEAWFHTAQIIYMIWNAVNDPLFAYWQDNSDILAFRSRRHSIMYGAPIFFICFLIAWFPWKHYEPGEWLIGVHLTVTLCCYDALMTFVMLAHCALFAEISTRHEDRIRLTRYATVGSIIGSFSVLCCEFVSDHLNNFHAFQMWCVFAGLVCWAGMHYTGKNVRTRFEMALPHLDELKPSNVSNSGKATFTASLGQFKEIVCGRNFMIFVFTNFCQLVHIEYQSSFQAIFVTQLIPETDFSSLLRKIMFGAGFIVPKLIVLSASVLVERYGYYRIMVWSFYYKIASAFFMYMLGLSHTHILIVFLFFDRTLPSTIFAFFNLSLSDIIDEDQQKYSRGNPLSSSVFGYNALFTKPAHSIAPMVVVAILNRYGYDKLQEKELSPVETEQLHAVMFGVACFIPIVTGVLQYVVWRNYTIRNSHITVQKHVES